MSQQGLGEGGRTESCAECSMGDLDCESDGWVGGASDPKFEGRQSQSFNHEVFRPDCYRTSALHPSLDARAR